MRIKRSNLLNWFVMIVFALIVSVIISGCTSTTTPSKTAKAKEQNGMKMKDSSSQEKGLNQKPKPMTIVRNGQNVTINMFTEETMVEVSPGVKFSAWTFDGTVPGPVLNLQQGDHVKLILHNLDPKMAHSIDLHAAMVDPSKSFVNVAPGKSETIQFDASLPGVFMYHCATEPMALHMAQGMYGAMVVTPKGQEPPTYTIVQSEFYKSMDMNSVINEAPNYVVFNGQANQYVNNPLTVKTGQPITVAFVNAGPNEFSAFHVVGTILRDVQASGNPQNHLYNVQTYSIAPGDGALIQLKFEVPGTYSFVSHSISSMDKGAVGQFKVTE
ncbi:MAG: multicopper oxidase domain-containing protein [Bacillota bacterium]|nr:multicopper oxidase domain-containing protein [Bacillota bacterium]